MAVYNENLRPPVDTNILLSQAEKDPVGAARIILSMPTPTFTYVRFAVALLDRARNENTNDQEIACLLLKAYALCDELH